VLAFLCIRITDVKIMPMSVAREMGAKSRKAQHTANGHVSDNEDQETGYPGCEHPCHALDREHVASGQTFLAGR